MGWKSVQKTIRYVSFAARELALVYLVVFVLMYAAGPGRYAVDTLIAQRIRAPKR